MRDEVDAILATMAIQSAVMDEIAAKLDFTISQVAEIKAILIARG